MLSHPEPKTADEMLARYARIRANLERPRNAVEDRGIDLKRTKPGWRKYDFDRKRFLPADMRDDAPKLVPDNDSERAFAANAHVLAYYRHMAAKELGKASTVQIEDVVADVLCVLPATLSAVRGLRRDRDVVKVRQAVQYAVMTELEHKSLPELGRYFHRDHTSLLNSKKKMLEAIGAGKAKLMTTPLGRNFYFLK